MEHDGDTPPYWSQPHSTFTHHRRQSWPLLNSVALILAVPILILILLFFVLPPFLSHASQIIRPSSVKKSWDYFNIVLVLFAILCGVFARRNDEVPSPDEIAQRQNSHSVTSVANFVNEPRHSVVSWLEFPDRQVYDGVTAAAMEAESGGVRLRRNSSSYPDLRHESLWGNGGGIGTEFRFYDDFELNNYRSRENSNMRRRISHDVVSEEAETVVREIPVDKFEVGSSPSPPITAPPPPPPPPAAAPKQRRTYQSVPREEKQVGIQKIEAELSENQPPEPPQAPPPPAEEEEPEFQFPDVISETVYRKKSGMKKELVTAIASLYKGQKRKRKKRATKNRDIYENTPHNYPPLSPAPQSTPPPPPPPPPPPITPTKKLQDVFKKGIKQKRVHSDPPAAPPPPPPPPPPPHKMGSNKASTKNVFNNIFKAGSKSKRLPTSFDSPPAPPPPPLPANSILNSIFNKTGNISRRFKNVTNTTPPPLPSETRRRREVFPGKPPKPPRPSYQYGESAVHAPPSPLIPMPPPPPPFRMAEVRFVARGDFVSTGNASSSPEIEDFDAMSVKSDGEDLIGPSVTCPSPDVNTKADNFIARLRDEWRLEKMNSMKEKRDLA